MFDPVAAVRIAPGSEVPRKESTDSPKENWKFIQARAFSSKVMTVAHPDLYLISKAGGGGGGEAQLVVLRS